MTRVLVTGASGFIGTPALARLLALGHDVHATARTMPDRPSGAAWHAVDLLAPDGPDVLAEAARPEAVLHLAWCAAPATYLMSPDNLAWVAATARLLVAVHGVGCRRTLVAGTCLEYGPGEDPADERTTPLVPDTPYALAKRGLHQAAAGWAGTAGHSLAWGRVFHLFGPGEPPGRLVPTVARAALAGERAQLSAGTQRRDFLYVDDVAAALVATLLSDVEGAVNIASGVGTRVADLAEMVAVAAGDPGCLDFGAVPTPDVGRPSLVAATRRLNDEVGWSVETPLPEAVDRTVRWWAERGAA